jgi:carbonic anhydrase
LMTFPFVRSRVEDQRLCLHAAYFDVARGSLSVRDSQTGNFMPLWTSAEGANRAKAAPAR